MPTDPNKTVPHHSPAPPPSIPRNNFVRSFGFAAAGLWFGLRRGRSFRIQLAAGAAAIVAGAAWRITGPEWACLLTTIALVLALEMFNTALEAMVDMVTEEFHPQAKIAKDAAAGAVLIAALLALGVGAAIFWSRIVTLFHV